MNEEIKIVYSDLFLNDREFQERMLCHIRKNLKKEYDVWEVFHKKDNNEHIILKIINDKGNLRLLKIVISDKIVKEEYTTDDEILSVLQDYDLSVCALLPMII